VTKFTKISEYHTCKDEISLIEAFIETKKTKNKSLVLYLECALAMVASEARLVEHFVISSELFHPVDFLFTCITFLCSACK